MLGAIVTVLILILVLWLGYTVLRDIRRLRMEMAQTVPFSNTPTIELDEFNGRLDTHNSNYASIAQFIENRIFLSDTVTLSMLSKELGMSRTSDEIKNHLLGTLTPLQFFGFIRLNSNNIIHLTDDAIVSFLNTNNNIVTLLNINNGEYKIKDLIQILTSKELTEEELPAYTNVNLNATISKSGNTFTINGKKTVGLM